MDNYFQIQNKLWIHKNIGPDQYELRPYYEFQYLVDEWVDHLQKQREQQEAEKAQMDKQNSQYNPDNYKPPDMPSMNLPDFN